MARSHLMHHHTIQTDFFAHILSQACGVRGILGWDARLKISLLVCVIGLNVGLAIGWFSFLLFLIGMALVIWSGIPFRYFFLFFLAPAWATFIVFLGFSVGFGTTPVLHLGPLTLYHEGMLEGLSAAARVACDMCWLALVFLTTPFTKVLGALRWFRLPAILVDTVAMAYRYAFLMKEEFDRMRDASRARGGFKGYGRAMGTLGLLLAKVSLRAYDRAGHIHQAMVSRGDAAVEPGENPTRSNDPVACPNRCDVTPFPVDGNVPILSCVDASYAYPIGGKGLRNINLQVAKGDVIVVCGPNGAGKTTLLKLISGILMVQKGTILLSGVSLDRKTRNEAFRYVGTLLEDPNDQLFCAHVKEDVAYGPRNLRLEEREVDRLVKIAMEQMEVQHLAERPIHSLSHGEMKRVGLAGLIALRPPLILLDEPTSGLDPASASHLIQLIRHLNSHHGYTFIIVTHDIDMAPLLANRMVVLNGGCMAADGSVREILSDMALLEKARLEPPTLTKLFQKINEGKDASGLTPLSIDEAVTWLKSSGLPLVNQKKGSFAKPRRAPRKDENNDHFAI
jgi:cobalt/nickel transport system ATP-binding protein